MDAYIKYWLASSKRVKTRFDGFTLLEIIVVVVVIGILFAIAAPVWTSSLNTVRLNAGQDEIFQAMRTAQSNAKLNRVDWQFSLRQTNSIVQWAIHPDTTPTAALIWKSLDSNIQLDAETTLREVDSVRRVQFSDRGTIHGSLGRVTLAGRVGGRTKRCVIVSTLLGAVRKGADHSKKEDDKYCY